MRLPDLKKLRHVTTVARAGSITSAASLLAITQSALTKSVAEVENQLGMAIFERLPRGMRLTEAGEVFVERAERLLDDAGDLLLELEDLNRLKKGHLKIGVAPAAFVTFLEGTLPAFARVYPGVHIEVRTGTIDEMARQLVTGQLDLCIGATNYLAAWNELLIQSTANLDYFFIGRIGHPATAGKKPTAADLLQYPLILPAAGLSTEVLLAQAYQSVGLSPRPPHYVCDHFPVLAELVAKTDAIAPLVAFGKPGDRLRTQFSVFEGVIKLDPITLGTATHKTRQVNPAASAFGDLFSSFLKSGGAASA